MKTILKSDILNNVHYGIRGPLLTQAQKMEEEGHQILKLNIGNPAPFGFDTPQNIIHEVNKQLPIAHGYTESRGIYSARLAIKEHYQNRNIKGIHVDDIFIGNGVSELIMIGLQALLNPGDEVLIPCPDYPLWTAAVSIASGSPIHYQCDEKSNWFPDILDIKKKINSNTKAIVLINPNNPTGAVYSKEILEDILALARQHNLVIFSDEIYDKILYDGAKHTTIASLADDVLIVTMSGLSKNYQVAGYRAGWMLLTGDKKSATDYIDGLNTLCTLRLCSNAPSQHAIKTALEGYQGIYDLVQNGGRLKEQRDISYQKLNDIDGISCVKPMGAMYCFSKVDAKKFNIKSEEKLMLDILQQEKILLVNGSAFNYNEGCYFRVVFLPTVSQLSPALDRLKIFFEKYQQE